MSYRVRTESFEGPFDLLLYLVSRQRVAIGAISIAAIADQYLAEVARMEVTPEEILLVDRMGKRYVRATRKELKDVLPKKADLAHLEKILFNASKPNGKKELSGKELGIPSLEKGRIELSGFSNNSFSLTPTELSSKYTQVELNEILEMLMSL